MLKKVITGATIGTFLGAFVGMFLVATSYMAKTVKMQSAAVQAIATDMGDLNTEEETNNAIEEATLRFHIRGNSNSDEDTELKYLVRDEVLDNLRLLLSDCKDLDKAEEIIMDSIPLLSRIASDKIQEEGYDYPVRVYMQYDNFPTRQYGEIVLPAGVYKALRIDIGEGQGENFWCLLYPTQCYTVDSGAVISDEDGKEIKRELTDEEYEKLFIKREIKKENIKVKFKLLEWLGL